MVSRVSGRFLCNISPDPFRAGASALVQISSPARSEQGRHQPYEHLHSTYLGSLPDTLAGNGLIISVHYRTLLNGFNVPFSRNFDADHLFFEDSTDGQRSSITRLDGSTSVYVHCISGACSDATDAFSKGPRRKTTPLVSYNNTIFKLPRALTHFKFGAIR